MMNTQEPEFYKEFYDLISPRAVKFAPDFVSSPIVDDFVLNVDTVKYACFQVPKKTQQSSDQIKIVVKVLRTKEEYAVLLPEDALVADVRMAASTAGAGVPESLKLVLKGKALQDHKSIQEYGIVDGTILQAMRKATPVVVEKTTLAPSAIKEASMPKEKKPQGVSMSSIQEDEAFWNDLHGFVAERVADPTLVKQLLASWRQAAQ